jgi:hypothetical protein
MPIKLISSGGGSVILDAPATGTNFNVTVPAENGSVITTAAASGINASAMSVGTLPYARLPSGSIVKTTSYNSGYGSGARTTVAGASTSWTSLSLNGTGRDSYSPPENVNIRYFDKVRSDTHLRLKTALPIYVNGGAAGAGFKIQMVLSNTTAIYNDGANYFTVGNLSTGQADRWGAAGYGGNWAGIVNAYYDTQHSTNSSNVLSYTGRLHFYFMVWTWAAGDTVYWLDYDNTYPKYGTWTVEEYVP